MDESKALFPCSDRIVAPVVDLTTLAGAIFFVPWLGKLIIAQSPLNHAVLLPGFLLIPMGVVSIRSLPKYSFNETKGLSLLAVCLVFFFVVIYSVLYAQAANIGGDAGKNGDAAFIVFFVFLIPVLVAFSWPTSPAEPGTRKELVAESVGLISVNYLTLIGAAVWECFSSLPAPENATYATGVSFLILFALLYLLFLAFFGLPRIYLLRATGDRLGLTVYLIWVAIFLWNKMPPVN